MSLSNSSVERSCARSQGARHQASSFLAAGQSERRLRISFTVSVGSPKTISLSTEVYGIERDHVGIEGPETARKMQSCFVFLSALVPVIPREAASRSLVTVASLIVMIARAAFCLAHSDSSA